MSRTYMVPSTQRLQGKCLPRRSPELSQTVRPEHSWKYPSAKALTHLFLWFDSPTFPALYYTVIVNGLDNTIMVQDRAKKKSCISKRQHRFVSLSLTESVGALLSITGFLERYWVLDVLCGLIPKDSFVWLFENFHNVTSEEWVWCE